MAANFRCEKCGKLLDIQNQINNAIRCPSCNNKIILPENITSLPSPHVPFNAATENNVELVEEQSGVGVVAPIMPWVISAFLHLGMFLIMLFFVMVTIKNKVPEVFIPDVAMATNNIGGVMNPKDDKPNRAQKNLKRFILRNHKRDNQIDRGKTDKVIQLIAPGDGHAGGADKLGLPSGNENSGPPSRIFGLGGNAYHIVYIIDRSGSMASTFQRVQFEMLKSIARLTKEQDFTIILFANNQYIEGPNKRLVLANFDNKIKANNFMENITAQSSTTVLPAIKRAFEVLKYADINKPGRLIYLLSDGDFAGISGGSKYKNLNGNEAIIQWLRDNNTSQRQAELVHINTFLYLSKDIEAQNVMKTIAKENSGHFKAISPDE